MRKHLWRTALLCAALAALYAAASRMTAPSEPAAPDAVLSGAALPDPPMVLCLTYYDARGRFLDLEITKGVTLDPNTGDAVLPIRNIPGGVAKMRVFLLDENLRVLAPVTEGDF